MMPSSRTRSGRASTLLTTSSVSFRSMPISSSTLVGRGNLIVHGRIGAVGHVQQQMGLAGFLQRRLETLDQMVRQVADEPHRVAQQHRPPAGQLPAARAGVERGEQGILHEHVGARQGVHQRALAGVRIADQGNRQQIAPAGHLALLPPLDARPIARRRSFRRCSTSRRSSSNCVSPGPRSPTPFFCRDRWVHMPLQPRHGVFELGQLDCQAGLARSGPG